MPVAPEIRTMPLADLAPAGHNPRRISDRAMAGLTASLRRFGLVQPIVWNARTRTVVGGHQRLAALAADGVAEAQVVVVDLPEAEERALNVALNNPAIGGEFTDGLGELLARVAAELPDLHASLRLDALAQAEGVGPDSAEPFWSLDGTRTRPRQPGRVAMTLTLDGEAASVIEEAVLAAQGEGMTRAQALAAICGEWTGRRGA